MELWVRAQHFLGQRKTVENRFQDGRFAGPFRITRSLSDNRIVFRNTRLVTIVLSELSIYLEISIDFYRQRFIWQMQGKDTNRWSCRNWCFLIAVVKTSYYFLYHGRSWRFWITVEDFREVCEVYCSHKNCHTIRHQFCWRLKKTLWWIFQNYCTRISG